MVLAMEGTSTPDNLQVQFWSGSNDSLLNIIDVLVTIQLSNESTAIIGTKMLGMHDYVHAYTVQVFSSHHLHKS